MDGENEYVKHFGVCPWCGRFLSKIHQPHNHTWQFFCHFDRRYFARDEVVSWSVDFTTGELEVAEPVTTPEGRPESAAA